VEAAPLTRTVIPTRNGVKTRMTTAVLLGLNMVALAGCIGRDEVARATSPSGKIDAVLVETNGGATTSFGYEVFVVPAQGSTWLHKRVAFLYAAARSEQAYGVNLKWAGPVDLTIEYLQARQEDLLLPNIAVAGEQVRVSLRSGVNDPKAPPGGMLYNLQRHPHGR
jgi:hypothetical protein